MLGLDLGRMVLMLSCTEYKYIFSMRLRANHILRIFISYLLTDDLIGRVADPANAQGRSVGTLVSPTFKVRST